MKTIKLIFTLSISLLIASSCRKGSAWPIRGKGPDVTQTRALTDFRSINVKCDADVLYKQDSVYRVEIKGQENILSVLETKVRDGELRLDYVRNVSVHNGVQVIIHAPEMNTIKIEGSGNFSAQNTMQTNRMGLYISGSGNITLPTLTCTTVDSKISGSGNVRIDAGGCSSADYEISGTGDVVASGFTCRSANVKIDGTGDVSINVTEVLDVKITGSGDVKYKGTPTITSKLDGSGKLIRIY